MRVDDLVKLLEEIGLSKFRIISKDEDTNIMFCCPFHGESNPSCGISANKEVGGCFACKQTFSLTYLVSHCKGISIKQAKDFLEEKYNVKKRQFSSEAGLFLKRYDDSFMLCDDEPNRSTRHVLPNYKLAPYKSGKVAHDYILSRGFDRETCRNFSLGWDAIKNRVTIPIKWEDGTLCGFIGRAVLEPKINGKPNPEYTKVYKNTDKYLIYEFPKSEILFPLDKFILPEDKSAILVEGSLDAMRFYQYGFNNALSAITAKLHKAQVDILHKLGVKRVILFFDNDEAGYSGMESAYKLLRDEFIVYRIMYPEGKNDPAELSKEEIENMLEEKEYYNTRVLKKVD
jgi:DNA primase